MMYKFGRDLTYHSCHYLDCKPNLQFRIFSVDKKVPIAIKNLTVTNKYFV